MVLNKDGAVLSRFNHPLFELPDLGVFGLFIFLGVFGFIYFLLTKCLYFQGERQSQLVH